MNAYYHSLIEEIKKEIDEKSYAQAYELICQELNMPYVPKDALELLEYYKSECKPYLEQKSKSCLLYTSPSPRDGATARMPSSA